MRKLLFFVFVITFCKTGESQYKVTFFVKENTFKKHDSIYVVGTFNNWDSLNNSKYLLTHGKDGEHSLTLLLKPGDYQYKFHRGGWTTVEKSFTGGEVDNKSFKLRRDTILYDTVFAWRDEIISDKWNTISDETNDSTRLFSFYALANIYGYFSEWYQIDSSLHYVSKALLLLKNMRSDPNHFSKSLRTATLFYTQALAADLLHTLGNFSKELEIRLDNLAIAKDLNDYQTIANAYLGIANAYASVYDYNRVLVYGKKLQDYLLQNNKHVNDRSSIYLRLPALRLVSLAYFNLNQYDSALYYAMQIDSLPTNQYLSTALVWEDNFKKSLKGQLLGDIYLKSGKDSLALQNYRSALAVEGEESEVRVKARYGLAMIYYRKGRIDSAFFYGKDLIRNINASRTTLQSFGTNANSLISELGPFVAELYNAMNKPDSAYAYLKLSVALKDSLFNLDKTRQFQNLSFNESLRSQQQEQEIKLAKQQYQAKVRTSIFIGGLCLLCLVAFILYRGNRQQKKANTKIEKAYSELKSTQQQLIQSEKMASLGELTAGIAHEIQNPLNFVNNFSEVNSELLKELKAEAAKGNLEEIKAIANDIEFNSEKINHHGKRADSIVKGMLQHSRTSSGQKEPTDINALCDEYLRLSYHGIRAKDKSFNATTNTEFDNSIEKIKVNPQDIGRVVLNLINNAFYAVNEKAKQNIAGYEPIVTVSTRKEKNKVEIKVKDNGNGIPQKILDKIFQPFFTTKPTGQGTGLGLSLAYDIIKAHNGELKVETKEGEGSEFIIQLRTI